MVAPLASSLVARFSPRLPATIGGLLTGLGWLFTSFSIRQHQVVISLGLFLGPGLALLNAATTTMMAQYFRKRRPLAESLVSASSGISVASGSLLLHRLASHHGWHHSLQAVAALSSLSALLALVFRPAALYHPQRPAILHLQMHMRILKLQPKRQKRAPSLFRLLRSPTVRILLVSFITATPLLLPFFRLAPVVRLVHIPEPAILCLQVDLAWPLARRDNGKSSGDSWTGSQSWFSACRPAPLLILCSKSSSPSIIPGLATSSHVSLFPFLPHRCLSY